MLFQPEEESCSLILQPWPLAVSPSHRPDTHKHTLTHNVQARSKPDSLPRPPLQPEICVLPAIPHLFLFLFFFSPCLYIVSLFVQFLDFYPLPLNLFFVTFPLLFIDLGLYPFGICPVRCSLFLFSSQLSKTKRGKEGAFSQHEEGMDGQGVRGGQRARWDGR